MKLKRPSHATVIAYLALFTALAGSAYAVSKVGSREVANNSLRSRDLRDGAGVTGRDIRDNRVTGEDIREGTLDTSGFAGLARAGGACDPGAPEAVTCAETTVTLRKSARVLAIGTGGFYSEGGPALSLCEIRIGGQFAGAVAPGEQSTDNTDAGATESFTVTGLSGVLPAGSHAVSLACNQVSGDARIFQPSVAAIALAVRD